MKRGKPEILAPASSLEVLKTALVQGKPLKSKNKEK